MKLPRQGGCQIEAKTVNVHFFDPIAQAVHDHLQHPRMGHIERIAAAGVVHVVAAVILYYAIVRSVVEAAEAEGRAHLISFARVVVNHIKNHLDAFAMQRPDHALEFGDLLADGATASIAGLRREITDGIIAPIIGKPAFL